MEGHLPLLSDADLEEGGMRPVIASHNDIILTLPSSNGLHILLSSLKQDKHLKTGQCPKLKYVRCVGI